MAEDRTGLTPDCGQHCFRLTLKGPPLKVREKHCKRKCCHGKGRQRKQPRKKKLW